MKEYHRKNGFSTPGTRYVKWYERPCRFGKADNKQGHYVITYSARVEVFRT